VRLPYKGSRTLQDSKTIKYNLKNLAVYKRKPMQAATHTSNNPCDRQPIRATNHAGNDPSKTEGKVIKT